MSEPIPATSIASQNSESQSWADMAGMMASIGCAIHCAAMPLVIAYLPALGLGWLADEGFHQWMAVICFGLAIAAFLPGWRKHRSLVPAALGISGVFLLSFAAYGLEESCCPSCTTEQGEQVETTPTSICDDEECTLCQNDDKEAPPEVTEDTSIASSFIPFITPVGGVLLVIGHLANHRKSCTCQGDECCLPTTQLEAHE